ncbi:hypothetical protein TWF225_008663 [Orbilia oligospora]|uniref:Small ribosomal subunit protein mS41 n=1 Tax=Orbilia oligospora TaxID=2813651 RepID=A0A4Z0Y2W2_ORBOL|nr:hypothetical protein TWF706_009761 [Orbilia oligospora]KAF3102739.1 hypothetical protein TWF102_004402 [Orbilia oligospora]KAF3110408.1 hypothetical protein TWF103_004686 [Orbilia oligospora]KAF3120477.1 hypothetical protein TWF594_003739 [Orbilia oligospora]KAF3124926.1 hypothetical protein TWF703_011134 [Orbilia oligospora]
MNRLRPLFPARKSAILDFLLPRSNHARLLHHSREPRPIPAESSTAPDVKTFLTKIGRNMIQHESKFTDWKQLMGTTTQQLRVMGIEPARDRRYLIDWRERYRNGIEPTEYKRGRKIDGGERRRKMVRALRRIAERQEQRKKEEQAIIMGKL